MWVVWRKVRKRRPAVGTQHYQQHKEYARAVILEHLERYNEQYQLPYKRVAIRNQRRCWGSCSALGNLNFSYKVALLPPCLRDYIIVHELCHLRELNHSARFWAAVAEALPDYQARAQHLRQYERTHGTSVVALKRLVDHHAEGCGTCQTAVPTSV